MINVRILSLPASIVALCLFTSVAHSQSMDEKMTGTRLIDRDDVYSERELQQDELGQMRDIFAKCVLQKHPTEVQKLIENSDISQVDYSGWGVSEKAVVKKLSLASCLGTAQRRFVRGGGGNLRMSPLTMRAMFVEKAYTKRHPVPPRWLLAIPEEIERRFVGSPELQVYSKGNAEFADCVVKKVPRLSDEIVRSPSRSNLEKAKVQEIVPHLGPCIADGYEVALNATTIRGYLADSLWNASKMMEAQN